MSRTSKPTAGHPIAFKTPRRGRNGLLTLRAGDVDLWRAPLDDQSDEALAALALLLSEDETARAREFYFERDRRRFVVGRGALRSILSRYLGQAPREIRFRYTAAGKPVLEEESGTPPLTFNLAHSDGLAVFAVTRTGEVGIDVERVREMPDWQTIAETFFPPLEQARLRAAPPPQRRAVFFQTWTRQEALLKASGVGLGGLDRGPERATNGEKPGSQRVANAGAWSVYPFEPAKGFVAALAIGRTGRWANCFAWETSDVSPQFRGLRRGRRTPLAEMAETGAEFI